MSAKTDGAFRAGKPPSQRQLRVGEELRHELAAILQRADFRDPDLLDLNVTVTEVRVSPDLRAATAFVTPLGGGKLGTALKALRRAAPYFRGQLAKTLKLRFAPTLSFEADVSFDYAGKIDAILHSPEVARDLAPAVKAPAVGDDEEEEGEERGA